MGELKLTMNKNNTHYGISNMQAKTLWKAKHKEPLALTRVTSLSRLIQESLANAKVRARQQCVYEGPRQRNLR